MRQELSRCIPTNGRPPDCETRPPRPRRRCLADRRGRAGRRAPVALDARRTNARTGHAPVQRAQPAVYVPCNAVLPRLAHRRPSFVGHKFYYQNHSSMDCGAVKEHAPRPGQRVGRPPRASSPAPTAGRHGPDPGWRGVGARPLRTYRQPATHQSACGIPLRRAARTTMSTSIAVRRSSTLMEPARHSTMLYSAQGGLRDPSPVSS